MSCGSAPPRPCLPLLRQRWSRFLGANRSFCNRVGQGPAWWPRRGLFASVRGRRRAATGYGQAGGMGQSSRRARRAPAPALSRPCPAASPRRDAGRRILRIAAGYAAATSRLQRHSLPSRQIRCGTTASFLATATLARRMPASALGGTQAPALQRRPAAGPGQEHVRRLAERLAGQTVALLAGVPGPVGLAARQRRCRG